MNHCIDCKHFLRHRETIRGPFWSDEDPVEIDSIYGDCRCHTPRAALMTARAVWPEVNTGEGCSEFSPKEPDHAE